MQDISGGQGKKYVAILFVTLVIVVGYFLLSRGVGSSEYTMTVKVIDSSSGYPISGANVTVDNITTIGTGPDGTASFNLPPGDHVISIQKGGYRSKSFTAGLSGDNLVTLDIIAL